METKRIELTDSGVLFNKELHEYWLGDKQLSGITGMLQRQLFPNEFEGIPEAMIQEAARYGTEVHESIEMFDSFWVNDGTQEVQDYITLCNENSLVHERSEYTVTDGVNWASNIDKVYRMSDDTFSIGDIKTYGTMISEKMEKGRWQLSIYAYFFELQNKGARVEKLFIIHLRNKAKSDGTFGHKAEILPVERIPSDICKELLNEAQVGDTSGHGSNRSKDMGNGNNEAYKENARRKNILQRRKVQGRPSRNRLHTLRKDIKRFRLSSHRSVRQI